MPLVMRCSAIIGSKFNYTRSQRRGDHNSERQHIEDKPDRGDHKFSATAIFVWPG